MWARGVMRVSLTTANDAASRASAGRNHASRVRWLARVVRLLPPRTAVRRCAALGRSVPGEGHTVEVLTEAAPLLTKPGPKLVEGRPRIPDRHALCGILVVLHTGIRWEYLPQELGFGSGMTCRRRLAATAGGRCSASYGCLTHGRRAPSATGRLPSVSRCDPFVRCA